MASCLVGALTSSTLHRRGGDSCMGYMDTLLTSITGPGGADVDMGAGRMMFHADLVRADPSTRQVWTATLDIKGLVVSVQ